MKVLATEDDSFFESGSSVGTSMFLVQRGDSGFLVVSCEWVVKTLTMLRTSSPPHVQEDIALLRKVELCSSIIFEGGSAIVLIYM